MPKTKSIIAKRKQRRLQKCRKRSLTTRASKIESGQLDAHSGKAESVAIDPEKSAQCNIISSQETVTDSSHSLDIAHASSMLDQATEGSQNGALQNDLEVQLKPSREISDLQVSNKESLSYLRTTFKTHEVLDDLRCLSASDRCEKLEELFVKKCDTIYAYKEKVGVLKKELKREKVNCKRSINEIRRFWKDNDCIQ